MKSLLPRLPARTEIDPAFGFLVFAVFTWSVRGFFSELPSLLLYYPLGEIFGVFSYMMAFALLESLLAMALLICAAMILPEAWFRRGFSRKAAVVVLVAGAFMIYLQNILTFQFPSLQETAVGAGAAFLLLFVLLALLAKVERFRSLFNNLLERFKVFSIIYTPLGVTGLVVVALRNLA